MSALTIYSDKDASQHQWHSTDAAEIAQQLNAKGVRFERWAADRDLGHDPAPEAVIAAYQHAIDKLVAEKGYQSWDVISLRADNPQKEALRAKFLNEHTHGEDEVRFFVEGAGLFCLHIGDEVYQVLCEKNDLISCPRARRTGLIWAQSRTLPPFVFSITRRVGWRSLPGMRLRMRIRASA